MTTILKKKKRKSTKVKPGKLLGNLQLSLVGLVQTVTLLMLRTTCQDTSAFVVDTMNHPIHH